MALPLTFALVISSNSWRTRMRRLVVGGAIGTCTYAACFAVGLFLIRRPVSVHEILAETGGLLRHHAELTDMKNPSTSGWITWLVPTRPLILGSREEHHTIRALTSLGNLATWWAAVVVFLSATAVVLRHGWSTVLVGTWTPTTGRPVTSVVASFVASNARSVLTILLCAVGFLAPWILTHRDSYIYHFLPVYVALVVLLAGFLDWQRARHPRTVFGFVVVVLLVAAFYGPLWAYLPISRGAMNLRLFIASWR